MKADQLSVIFITDNPLLSDGAFDYAKLEPEEKDLYDIFSEGITLADGRIPIGINVKTMSKYAHLDSVDFERWGIHRFPAIRVYAHYPDGKESFYNLVKGPFDSELDVSQKNISDRLYFLYLGNFGKPSLLCEMFPPLCKIGAWAWLAIGAFSTYKALESKSAGKVVWGLGAGLCLNEFMKRGGLTAITQTDDEE